MVNLTHYGTYPGFILDQRNNLFYRGNYAYSTYGTNTLSWTVKDCLFDCDSLPHWGEPRITNSNNGYLSGLSTLQGGSNNKTNLAISYQAGAATNWYGVLGTFYYPTNGGASSLTNLFNAGSRSATNAGLYHFTTTTNQVKETNSVVDIGYHFVATDANGNPLDYDGDGVPDYFEDLNGNGTPDSGETGWQSASDTGLKVWITEPKNNSNLP
jgi:hypothetical protein